jgi:hypothetical protein
MSYSSLNHGCIISLRRTGEEIYMNTKNKFLSLIVIIFGVISLAMGAVFIQQGFSKEAWLVKSLEQEQVVLPGSDGVIVNNSSLAEEAANTIKGHRRSIAPTYSDLLGGKQFDPANPTQLKYAQAMNLENSLSLAVTAFGVFTVVKAAGAFMVVTGLALGATGFALRSSAR